MTRWLLSAKGNSREQGRGVGEWVHLLVMGLRAGRPQCLLRPAALPPVAPERTMPSPEVPLPLPSPLPPRPLRPALKVRLEPLHRTLRFPWRPLTPIVSSSSPFSALLLYLLCLISTCPWQARTTPIFPSVSQMGPRMVQGLPKVSGLSTELGLGLGTPLQSPYCQVQMRVRVF